MNTGIAIFIGAILATVGWLHSARQQRLTNRRQHTYQIVIRQMDDENFLSSLQRTRAAFAADNLPSVDDKPQSEEAQGLDYLLNHYEFLCAAIWCGDVDEGLMKSCEESRLTKLFTKAKPYVDANRGHFDQPSMWENMEKLIGRWGSWPPSTAEYVYELLYMKPCRECPSWIFSVGKHMDRATDWGTRVKTFWPNRK